MKGNASIKQYTEFNGIKYYVMSCNTCHLCTTNCLTEADALLRWKELQNAFK